MGLHEDASFNCNGSNSLSAPDDRCDPENSAACVPHFAQSRSTTKYFGGIDISICTWSGIRCPSGTCTPMSRGSGDYDPVTLRSPCPLAVPQGDRMTSWLYSRSCRT